MTLTTFEQTFGFLFIAREHLFEDFVPKLPVKALVVAIFPK